MTLSIHLSRECRTHVCVSLSVFISIRRKLKNMIGYKSLCTSVMKKSRMINRCLTTVPVKRQCSKATSAACPEDDEKTTHFGYQTVRESEKVKEGNFVVLLFLSNGLPFTIYCLFCLCERVVQTVNTVFQCNLQQILHNF